jgi:hypothetical protein
MNGSQLRGIDVHCHFGFPNILVNKKLKKTSTKLAQKDFPRQDKLDKVDDAKPVANVVNVPKSTNAVPLATAATSEQPERPPNTPNRAATLLVKNIVCFSTFFFAFFWSFCFSCLCLPPSHPAVKILIRREQRRRKM